MTENIDEELERILADPDRPLTCAIDGLQFDDEDALVFHVKEHSTEIRPPDMAAIRDRLSRDLIVSLGFNPENIDMGVVNGVVDNAMFHLEHLTANQFPVGSRTSEIQLPIDTVGQTGAFDTFVALFMGLLEQLVEDQDEREGTREPDRLTIRITTTPEWTT